MLLALASSPRVRSPCIRASAIDAPTAASALANMHDATLERLVAGLQVDETTDEYVATTGYDAFTLRNGRTGTVRSFEPQSASSKVAWCSVSLY